jgi:transcriptional regulator with XRE-family HTH domain
MSWDTLAEGIAQARRELGVRQRRDVPQEEIASAVGVSVAAYSRWEKGERVPNEDYVRKLALFFGVTPAFLRYGLVVPAPPEVLDQPPVAEDRVPDEEVTAEIDAEAARKPGTPQKKAANGRRKRP